jgi:DNA modification methylase
VLADGAAIYVAHPAGALSVVFAQRFLAQGWRLHQTLVWVKDSLVPGHSDYQYRHEPVLFGYKAAQGRRGRGSSGWYGGNDCSSVFEVPRPKASPDHPTSKPVALVEAMVKNSSRSGEVVLDPFLGSGSTLIACERLGRHCYGIELDPRYVDVAVKRWETFTGRKAEKLS